MAEDNKKDPVPVGVCHLVGGLSDPLHGSCYEDGEPLDAEMLTSESYYLIDLLNSHQLLPTVVSGLVGKLEWSGGTPNWSSIEIKHVAKTRESEGKYTLPAGTVFRLNNGFIGRLQNDLSGSEKAYQFVVVERKDDRHLHSESRYTVKLVDEEPRFDTRCGYCKATFKGTINESSDLDAVYLKSTLNSTTLVASIKSRLDDLIHKIQLQLYKKDPSMPHETMLLLQDLRSFSTLKDLTDSDWVEVRTFQREFLSIAKTCKAAWDCFDSKSVNEPVQTKLLEWLKSYEEFFNEKFEDLTWQDYPARIHDNYAIEANHLVGHDYSPAGAILLSNIYQQFRNAIYRKSFAIPYGQNANQMRLYIKSATSTDRLIFNSDFQGGALGLKEVRSVRNQWHYIELDNEEVGIDGIVILSNEEITQIHLATRSVNQ